MTVGPTGLAKVGADGIKLPPSDGDDVGVCRIDGDRGFVGGVKDDVSAVGRDIDLNADILTTRPDGGG